MAFWESKGARLAREATASIESLTKTIDEHSKNDIKARDRVDITLEEYEHLKHENELLHKEVTRLRVILTNFRVPVHLWKRVKPDTIKTSVCHNVRDFVDTFCIEFDVDVPYPYGEDYEY